MNNQNMNNITAATNESHEIAINITRKAFVGWPVRECSSIRGSSRGAMMLLPPHWRAKSPDLCGAGT